MAAETMEYQRQQTGPFHLPVPADNPTLSLIIPAYNEGPRLQETLQQMVAYLAALQHPYEIIVVDDGSSDNTAAVVAAVAANTPTVRLLSHYPNRGKGYAVRQGMLAATGDYRIFTDADLSIPLSVILKLVAALDAGYDLAAASRWHPASTQAVPPPLPRLLMGTIFRWCVRRLVVSDLRDTQCGCKGYRADVAEALFSASQIDRFSFDAEVIFLAAHAGYQMTEVPFALSYKHGSTVRPLRDAAIMLRDLLRIRFNAARGRYQVQAAGQVVRRAG